MEQYLIYTENDLINVGVNYDKECILMNDIHLENWETLGPIVTPDEEDGDPNPLGFRGTLDGNGFTITGLRQNGLIKYLSEGAVIKDLVLEDMDIEDAPLGNAFASVSIQGCHFSGKTEKGGFLYYCGGESDGIEVIDCHFDGETGESGFIESLAPSTSGKIALFDGCTFTGTCGKSGIIGYSEGTVAIKNCHVSGTIGASGLANIMQGQILIQNCHVEGEVGSCGLIDKIFEGGTIENCTVDADINAPFADIGGILGTGYGLKQSTEIKNCSFEGSIIAARCGGIVMGISGAEDTDAECSILNCTVDADLTGSTSVGGIVCYCGNESNPGIQIIECTVEGTLTGGRVSGVAETFEGSLMKNCTVDAVIAGDGDCAGIVGAVYYNPDAVIEKCSFGGEITSEKRACGIGYYSVCEVVDCTVEGDLTSTSTSDGAYGMMGFSEGSSIIRNCSFIGTLENSSSGWAAGMGGHLQGTIENCSFAGTVKNSGTGNAAGMADRLDGVTMNRCSFEGDIISNSSAYGVSYYLGGELRECAVRGNISSMGDAYGVSEVFQPPFSLLEKFAFIGTISASGEGAAYGASKAFIGTMNNCFIRADITSETTIYGFALSLREANDVKHFYFEGTLNAPEVFGITDWEEYSGDPLEDATWFLCANVEDAYGIQKTEEEMKDPATFVGWDFEDVWMIDPKLNDGFPMFGFLLPPKPTPKPLVLPEGKGADVGVYVYPNFVRR